MNTQQLNSKPTFGGHEKFPFRYGWLKKGIDAVTSDPTIFAHDQALVKLGVGKNMVRAIRHWCLATNLVAESEGTGRTKQLSPTTLAKHFLLDKGWDPYLEDIGSYWLIHWELTSNVTRALIWHYLFARFYKPEFTKQQFIAFCAHQLENANIQTTQPMIEREVDCCLRTYVVPVRLSQRVFSEDSLDCPLVELGLMRFASGENIYTFNIGPKPTLPVQVFGYTLLKFLSSFAHTRRTIAIDDCLYFPGSPGQVFKLDENSLIEYLEAVEGLSHGKLRLQESAGLRQIYLDDNILKIAIDEGYKFLDNYYA